MKQHSGSNSGRNSATGFALVVFLAIVAFFLITEHRAHLFGILPFILLLLCPLLHLLMHRQHGGHSHKANEQEN
jgi:heme/copper-type cytochrome/quinol oxidase subunit 4